MSKFFHVREDEVAELILEEAARVIESGDLIVLPTDTVYGIGADAFSADAVADLLDAKRRGRDMPPPVLIPRAETLYGLAADVPDDVMKLVDEFWPGPLTIICNAQLSLDWDLGDTHGTVAVRMPDEATALALLHRTGPLAVSSANLSGLPPAATATDARDQLDESVSLYLEAGHVGGGTSSTIVDSTTSPMRVLRAGGIGIEPLRRVVPTILDIGEEPEPVDTADDTGPIDTAGDTEPANDESDARDAG